MAFEALAEPSVPVREPRWGDSAGFKRAIDTCFRFHAKKDKFERNVTFIFTIVLSSGSHQITKLKPIFEKIEVPSAQMYPQVRGAARDGGVI